MHFLGTRKRHHQAEQAPFFIPSLNYEFYQHFGKVGESFVAPGFSSYGGGSPAAEWLLQGGPGSLTGTFVRTLSSTQLLPGAASRIFTSQAFGQNTLLNTENTNLRSGGIPGSEGTLWNADDEVTATIFGVTREGSDEFSWRASPFNGTTPNFFQPNSATGTTSMGLDTLGGQFLSQDIGLLPSNGSSRQQLIVKGDGINGAELVGVRFTNLSTPGGVSIQDFAAGGYTTASFLNNHADAGRMLLAFGEWDAVLIHTGANDAYRGVGASAEEYQRDVAAFIATVRSADWLDNPNQKFILVTDPYREGSVIAKFGIRPIRWCDRGTGSQRSQHHGNKLTAFDERTAVGMRVTLLNFFLTSFTTHPLEQDCLLRSRHN